MKTLDVLERFVPALKTKLQENPNHIKTLQMLGQYYRMKGQLKLATPIY